MKPNVQNVSFNIYNPSYRKSLTSLVYCVRQIAISIQTVNVFLLMYIKGEVSYLNVFLAKSC